MKRWLAIILVGILLIGCGSLIYFKIYKIKDDNKVIKEKPLETIKGFDYKLEKRDNSLYKNEFLKLKEILEKENIDYEKYAESIAKLFIIDLYTLDNKVNKYDVGGTEFVHPDILENYKVNVEDTIYKYLEDNINENREQELPVVSKINSVKLKDISYQLKDENVDAYEVSISWDYKKDLDYDKQGTIIIVKKDNYLYIVEKNNEYIELTDDDIME